MEFKRKKLTDMLLDDKITKEAYDAKYMEESILQIVEQINQLHKKTYDIYLPLVHDVCVREVSEEELSICLIIYWILPVLQKY